MKNLLLILFLIVVTQLGLGQSERYSYDTLYHKENYSKVFELIKQKGDSIVEANFGSAFFNSNISFSEELSFFNCWNTLKWNHNFDWNDKDSVQLKPDRAALIYNIKFLGELYSTIEISMDSNGVRNIIASDDGKLTIGGFHGLTKCESTCIFNITKDDLKRISKEQNTRLKRKTKINLRWKPNDGFDIYSNYYGYYQVELQTYSHKERVELEGCTKVIAVYDVLIINPWTGKFIRKTKMTGLVSASTKTNLF